jgi:phosphoglycolate phosphatase-like HAD superfamily hydrolase
MPDGAVIFDVDGVLLDMTVAEEDAFFHPFEKLYGLAGLSRDWDSYRVRNDCDIAYEILERHLGKPPASSETEAVMSAYISRLSTEFHTGNLSAMMIPGADHLLAELSRSGHALGIATANLLPAARIRLEATGLWSYVSSHPFGAEPGGPKRDIVARAIGSTRLPRSRIVYIGDNLNDVDAGLSNGVHFIGFSRSEEKRHELRSAGAAHVAGDHAETANLIALFLE